MQCHIARQMGMRLRQICLKISHDYSSSVIRVFMYFLQISGLTGRAWAHPVSLVPRAGSVWCQVFRSGSWFPVHFPDFLRLI